MQRSNLWGVLGMSVALAGCSGIPSQNTAPAPCGSGFAARAPLYKLADTRAPSTPPKGKSAPLQFAVGLPVNKTVQQEGRWTDLGGGWSSLALRLRSGHAMTLSAHFKPATLPEGAQLWLCSADGKLKQGPTRAITGGELYTPLVPGNEAWLDVIVPTANRRGVELTLVEAFGGFR